MLEPLGADIKGSQFLDPDGSFPNHIPNPEHPSAMAAGSKATTAAGADLGIVFDTDVNRWGGLVCGLEFCCCAVRKRLRRCIIIIIIIIACATGMRTVRRNSIARSLLGPL